MRNLLFIFLLATAVACAPSRYLKKEFHRADLGYHSGFVLADLETGKTLFDYQGNRYFTPASNTKIFTFYTALQILPDSIPALHYEKRGDSLIVAGTGDPSFLYRNAYTNERVFRFLKSRPEKLYLTLSNWETEAFGPGWAWDDYLDDYQVERSAFPVYGNRFRIEKKDQQVRTIPSLFEWQLAVNPEKAERPMVKRALGSNETHVYNGKRSKPDSWEIPFHVEPVLFQELLSDTLGKSVTVIKNTRLKTYQTHFSVPADSLYKPLMQESDNFIAEQLLLLCADKLSDTLKTSIAIRESKKTLLQSLPDEPVWVDGSGLSRYNLFTPRSIVQLWMLIYKKVPRERLFYLLARGGETGTIKNNYKGSSAYIFGKTGTLSNNHALSGYLVTRSGKTLVFSWMNSNFTSPNSSIRARMETVLRKIYETY